MGWLLLIGFIVFIIWSVWYSNSHPDEMRAHYQHEEWKKNPTDEQGQVCCPKCRCTQIQMVNRKWSATTGFMTNKVDRVCMKCKHRF